MRRMTFGRLVLGIVKLAMDAYMAYKLVERSSSYSFQGRVVLITGGSRGLGLVLARQLIGRGAKLALLSRDAAELERAADELRLSGGAVLIMTGDVGQREVAEAAVEQTVSHYGRLDIVINNAGIIQTGPGEHMKLEDFEQAMAVHFWGPLYTTRAALPHLQRQAGARIVNIASIGGKLPFPHLLPYCSSKFALVGLSSGLRIALLRHGIPVTTVCPGLLRTGSHLNALFKGRHQEEYLWFATGNALPLISASAVRAAQKILVACQHGDAELVIGRPYRIAACLAPFLPELCTTGLALLNRLMPGSTGRAGDVSLPGWVCRSLTPTILTWLTDRAALANNELPRPAAECFANGGGLHPQPAASPG